MRKFFNQGTTRSYEFRIKQLEKLKDGIEKHEDQIMEALKKDLGKPKFEAYTAEIAIVYQEIDYAIKNLRNWMKPKKVATPIYLQPARSFIHKEAKGIVLIISPWNYPFQLAISSLVGAIAAGNCVVLKPSNKSKETEKVIEKIINESYPRDYVSIVKGPGSEVVTPLIENNRFDHIFFTGSVKVGKKIMELAAKHLSPVTLELGGKSPVIVHEDADIDNAAKRISWAKFYNCGQTCIAPDYLLVHESKKEVLIERIKFYLLKYYGEDPAKSPNLGRIINNKSFNRLISLLQGCQVILGAGYSEEDNYIAPTLVEGVTMEDQIMQEEIFGPILPILSYKDISQVIEKVRLNPYPLALYLFTENQRIEKYILENIQFGGGCINHLIVHVANQHLPFGGVGFSGMGNYHSKYTFDTFTHKKSILKSKSKIDTNMLYPPYKDERLNLVKKFL